MARTTRRAALCLLLLATLTAASPASARPSTRTSTIPWQLVEAGADGRSLRLLVGWSTLADCEHVRVRASSETSKRIRIRVTRTVRGACPSLDDLRPQVRTVRLARKLRGQVISGPKRLRSAVGVDLWRSITAPLSGDAVPTPRLLGLRGTDAQRIGVALGMTRRLGGNAAQAVVTQAPEPGAPFQFASDQLLLTTAAEKDSS